MLRITSENVMDLLNEFPDVKGTKDYLQVTKSITSSYLNKDLNPICRIKESWFHYSLLGTGDSGYYCMSQQLYIRKELYFSELVHMH